MGLVCLLYTSLLNIGTEFVYKQATTTYILMYIH